MAYGIFGDVFVVLGYGRILYHWKTKNITDTPWEFTGEIIRCDPRVGESIDDWRGQEWIQSPYIVKDAGKYYMFYGGHSTGRSRIGRACGRDDKGYVPVGIADLRHGIRRRVEVEASFIQGWI